ncbi:MAG: hypothetical protein J2P15_23120, partial [Micromonosporaceae bacterium]|nr:hypothetical protein [Micromonosporaceae bacterium]
MAELGETTDPKQLIPGDVSAIASTMWAMRTYGDTLAQAGTGLSRIDTTGGWRSGAADRFRAAYSGEPSRWTEAGTSFHNAADAIDGYASTLGWAQGRAQDAINLWAQGVHATATARAEYDKAKQGGAQVGNFVDPGAGTRQSAQEILTDARLQLKRAGDTANKTVGAARDKAPPEPGFWSKVGDFFGGVGSDLLHGGEDVLNGLASFGNAMINNPGD